MQLLPRSSVFTYKTCSFYLQRQNLHSDRWRCFGITLLLANILLKLLEVAVLPTIKKGLAHWKRHVNVTNAPVDPSEIKYVLKKLNEHHPSIQFTHYIEENQKITFLDILVTRPVNNKLEKTVFRKFTM